MHFMHWKNASMFIEDIAPKLDAGTAKCFVKGKTEPIPWRSVVQSGVDGWWTRFCIADEEVGGMVHYVVSVATWPEGALKDANIKPTIEEVDRIEEPAR